MNQYWQKKDHCERGKFSSVRYFFNKSIGLVSLGTFWEGRVKFQGGTSS